jgi:hypothetical protein
MNLDMPIELQWMKKLAKPTLEHILLGNTIINLTSLVRIILALVAWQL